MSAVLCEIWDELTTDTVVPLLAVLKGFKQLM